MHGGVDRYPQVVSGSFRLRFARTSAFAFKGQNTDIRRIVEVFILQRHPNDALPDRRPE